MMRPDISKLIERLNTGDINAMKSAAVVLQAVFEPENQPSQFGTCLWRSGDHIPEWIRGWKIQR